jgi:hypothetical protein
MAIVETGGMVIANNLEQNLGWIITLGQIFLGIVGITVIFWIINLFINYRKNKLLKQIISNLEEINMKLGKKK